MEILAIIGLVVLAIILIAILIKVTLSGSTGILDFISDILLINFLCDCLGYIFGLIGDLLD
jgi:hypothetical protein